MKICEKCGKGSQKGASRSHSNVKTIRHNMPNLQSKWVDGKKMTLCTGCLSKAKQLATLLR